MAAAKLWKFLSRLRLPEAAQIRDALYLVDASCVLMLIALPLTAYYPYVYLNDLMLPLGDDYAGIPVAIASLITGSTIESFLSGFSLLDKCVWNYAWSKYSGISTEESKTRKDKRHNYARTVASQHLRTSLLDGGLTESEVAKRRLIYGPNEPWSIPSWPCYILQQCCSSWYVHSLVQRIHHSELSVFADRRRLC